MESSAIGTRQNRVSVYFPSKRSSGVSPLLDAIMIDCVPGENKIWANSALNQLVNFLLCKCSENRGNSLSQKQSFSAAKGNCDGVAGMLHPASASPALSYCLGISGPQRTLLGVLMWFGRAFARVNFSPSPVAALAPPLGTDPSATLP